MSNSNPSEEAAAAQSADESSVLFAQLVVQQANLAMMLLGKVAHPETGQVIRDIDAAKHFIDTLEMLEGKTKGNLSREEAGLLKQSLMSLRLAFVEAVEAPAPQGQPATPPQAAPASGGETTGSQPAPEAPKPEEHRPKFSKKY
jgi:hypothetical protein